MIIKLTKKLQGESVKYLEDYLQKERVNPLLKEKIKAIKELIKKEKEENSKFAKKIINSFLSNLAFDELIRENKVEITNDKINHQKIFHVNSKKVVLKMFDTVKEAENSGSFRLLNKYLEGKHNGRTL